MILFAMILFNATDFFFFCKTISIYIGHKGIYDKEYKIAVGHYMITYRKHAVKSSSSSLVTSMTETHGGVPSQSCWTVHSHGCGTDAVPAVTSVLPQLPLRVLSARLLEGTAGSSYRLLRLTGLVQAAFIHLGKSSLPKGHRDGALRAPVSQFNSDGSSAAGGAASAAASWATATAGPRPLRAPPEAHPASSLRQTPTSDKRVNLA